MNQYYSIQSLFTGAFEKGSEFIKNRLLLLDKDTNCDIRDLCKLLISSRGEVSGVAIASRILDLYLSLSKENRLKFFIFLSNEMNPDGNEIVEAAIKYSKTPSPAFLSELLTTAEPPRQELFRRLNLAPGGTEVLVEMRRQLLELIEEKSELAYVDMDLEHLFSSWFNRGFLELRSIEWTSPAHILEKIVIYETIHEIRDWEELRNRLLPRDRRCFGFFHPAFPDVPLIFVEVALLRGIPVKTSTILSRENAQYETENPDSAVFYSINKCHKGLRGIGFGNFLIKQVAKKLSSEIPTIKNFVTLSPVPGFVDWLKTSSDPSSIKKMAVGILNSNQWLDDPALNIEAQNLLMPLAAKYLTTVKRRDGFPLNAVARFHLGNGSVLENINWMADTSEVRMKQSAGIMVNYLYVPEDLEDNHEDYANSGTVKISNDVKNLAEKAETIS